MTAVVDARGVAKSYTRRGFLVSAVASSDLVIEPGEVVALIGQSGSGKTTLLNLLLGWERADQGTIALADGRVAPAQCRWHEVAVLPQALAMLADLTIAENILLPARARRRTRAVAPRADALMTRLGIDHLQQRFITQVSLGEQQRAALARALLLAPRLVIADEPTAHQDARSVGVLLDLVRAEARAGTAFLIATHDDAVRAAADRVVQMDEGVLT